LRFAVGLHDNANAKQLGDITEKLEKYIQKNVDTLSNREEIFDRFIKIKIKSMHKKLYPYRPLHIQEITTNEMTFDKVPVGFCLVGADRPNQGRVALLYEIRQASPGDSEPTHYYAIVKPQRIRIAENQNLNFTLGALEAHANTFNKGGIPDAVARVASQPNDEVRIVIPHQGETPVVSRNTSQRTGQRP
jgi:hypothetical protein